MKTMDDLIAESRDRAKARFAERKEIASKSLQLRIEGAEVRRRVDEQAPGFASTLAITDEAISTAERLIHTLDSCTERMEYLRLELIQIALGERFHQTERPPLMDDLIRDLGELAALLKVREAVTREDAA